jgi:hypothetical protein
MAKIIAVSADDVTYYNLPGNQGDLSRDGTVIDDTIFGQTFKSGMTGIIGWALSANAVYKGFAGYQATIKKTGTATTMTGEACTLVSGKTYRITNSAHRILDRSATWIVYDNGVDHTADVENIDYLFGTITFKAAYTITGPITVDGKWFPTAALGKARSYTLTQTADAIDTTDFGTAAANGGYKTHVPGLRTVTLELPGVYDSVADFQAQLTSRSEVLLEICPDGAQKSLARGFFRLMSTKQSGNVGALEEENLSFSLSVPIDVDSPAIYVPFGWQHDVTSTIPTAVKKILEAWLGETLLYGKYLHNGTTGFKGQGVVTNFTMTGAMDAMNSFQFGLQGSGSMTSVP